MVPPQYVVLGTGGSATGGDSKWDQILLVKIGKYIGFCVYRSSYLLWSLAYIFAYFY